ncbi:MAG: ISL3 family transposase [Myxococcaceae bacterium]|nr:MAG: ISL3 family transposase [Myxococcaceae bacterium]
MRGGSVFARLLGLGRAVVEGVTIEEDEVVVRARLRRRDVSRCGVCGRRAPGYDRGAGRRRWRALDLGATRAFVEAEAPRVSCREHGVVVARVPWARHGSWFTREFEDQAGWLASYCSKSAVCELMRISWLTVGRIIERVVADEQAKRGDRLAGLRRIGIDELSYRKGQRYITAVVCHDSGRLVWAADGRDKKTVARFFDELGKQRCSELELVSSDLGEWITRVVGERCPNATLCLDPFHIVSLASDALDEVRREVWNEARRSGDSAGARWLKGARWALWKRPERLSERQQAKLATIARVNRQLYRAYLLKEQLRIVFQEPDTAAAIALLEAWLAWARRCRIKSFVKLAKTISEHYAGIVATLTHRLSNARTEAVNTTLRLITRRAYGFHSADALIALAMLTVGGLRPALPGRPS